MLKYYYTVPVPLAHKKRVPVSNRVNINLFYSKEVEGGKTAKHLRDLGRKNTLIF
jgi:hypothetical protein